MFSRSGSGPTVLDLFCGAGGLSEGFSQAGFNVIAGQDIDETAGKTFAATHRQARFVGGPIQGLSARDLIGSLGSVDVIVGGPPCQGYSYYNHGRGTHDPRAGLFKEYLRIVSTLRPNWLVMENVAGITSIGRGAVVDEILSGMMALGYRVEMRLLRAEEYGVPQERRRMFFIATRTDAAIRFPRMTHGPGTDQPFVTIWDAISDLPPVPNAGGDICMSYASKPLSAYQATLRGRCTIVTNHQSPKLATANLKRLEHIPPGGSWRDIPFDLLPAGMRLAKRSDHTKRYGRPRWDELACTILTKCDVHWGAYFHPEQARSLTPREAARLQSFPDRFQFHGRKTDQFIQIGNAVPPLLGKAVACCLLTAMQSPVEVAGPVGIGVRGDLELAT